MSKGIEFIEKVKEAWIPSSVFGSDIRSAGCADGGGTVGAVIGGGRHEDGEARGDVSNDFMRAPHHRRRGERDERDKRPVDRLIQLPDDQIAMR